jgi:hypothetical protein
LLATTAFASRSQQRSRRWKKYALEPHPESPAVCSGGPKMGVPLARVNSVGEVQKAKR